MKIPSTTLKMNFFLRSFSSFSRSSRSRSRSSARARSPELIAGVLDGLLECFQVDFLGIIAHLGLLGGEIDRRLLHPFQSRQGLFHPDHAGGAAHAAHGQVHLLQLFVVYFRFI